MSEKKLERYKIFAEKSNFCKKCVMSNQRPRTKFIDGVCSACIYLEQKKSKIDWKEKSDKLEALLDKYRSNNGQWDVVVPGSGGKDLSICRSYFKGQI